MPPGLRSQAIFGNALLTIDKSRCILVEYLEEEYGENQSGPVARDTRFADSENAGTRANAWLGGHATYSADFGQRAPGEPGVALSRAASAGRAGLDPGVLGQLRE